MAKPAVSADVNEALRAIRRRVDWQAGLYITFEVILCAIAVSKPGVPYPGPLRWLPPPYVVTSMAGLVFVMIVFVRFMLSYSRQADLSAYSVKTVRPAPLIAVFILFSLGTIIFLFAILYQWTGIYGDSVLVCENGKCISNSLMVHDLCECLYFSVITLTTVGYGDYHPINSLFTHAVAAGEALSGYVILGVLVSTLSNMLRDR